MLDKGREGLGCIEPAQNRIQWWDLVVKIVKDIQII